jgi:hypothetical protein
MKLAVALLLAFLQLTAIPLMLQLLRQSDTPGNMRLASADRNISIVYKQN